MGAAKTAARHTGAYARIRHQFNLPIGFFEGVEEALARIAGYCLPDGRGAHADPAGLDCGEKPSVISAIVKYHLTERYRRVVNDAMDIHGGSGICLGPVQHRGPGLPGDPHQHHRRGRQHPDAQHDHLRPGRGALPPLGTAGARRRRTIRIPGAASPPSTMRCSGTPDSCSAIWRAACGSASPAAVSRARLCRSPTRRYYQQLNWMSAAFALCADAAMMTLGGSLKRRERLSARLGDVLSELYLASAVLKRFEDEGRPG